MNGTLVQEPAPLDAQTLLPADLRAGVCGRPDGTVGHAGAVQASDEEAARADAERTEAFVRRIYKVRTAANHAIDALCQSRAGSVNADKLRMLAEDYGDGSFRVGNFVVTPCRQ